MKQITEYEVTYDDHNVDHISRKDAMFIVANPPSNIILLEKVTRYGDSDPNGEEYDEKRKYETLFEREEFDDT